MKRLILLVFLVALNGAARLNAQEQEVQQLLLNVEKLAQLKQLLTDMKTGYRVLSNGYGTIKDLSQGNFSLHQTYLDGLLQINPAIRNYKRVGDIIRCQVLLVEEYKQAYNRFKQDGNFNPQELAYIGRVYGNLLEKSLSHLDELGSVLTANQLRMSDEERLRAIDNLYAEMQDKILFLRHFNQSTMVLAVQRAREKHDVATIRNIYGLTQ